MTLKEYVERAVSVLALEMPMEELTKDDKIAIMKMANHLKAVEAFLLREALEKRGELGDDYMKNFVIKKKKPAYKCTNAEALVEACKKHDVILSPKISFAKTNVMVAFKEAAKSQITAQGIIDELFDRVESKEETISFSKG